MDLLLWRHADAADGSPDHERPLTAKGRSQAKRMAAWINTHLPANATVLVSPAVRAQQTAAALKRDCVTSVALSTDSDCATVLKTVGRPAAGGVTLVVGHQPTLGHVASLLLTGTEGDLSIKKGAVWWIAVRPGRRSLGVLKAVMTPEML
jgi:phosphohistidine phosphatase